MGTRESSINKKGVGFQVQCNYCDKQFWIGSGHRIRAHLGVQSISGVNKCEKVPEDGVRTFSKASACKFVSRLEKHRTRSERKFGLKQTERS